MPLPLRLRHIPIPCSAATHTPLQMACWLQSRIQQSMVDNRLEDYLRIQIPKTNYKESQRQDWIKQLLAVNVPPSSHPKHVEHLLRHVGPPPTVISFMPQAAFDVPGLAVDARFEKAQRFAVPLPQLLYLDISAVNRFRQAGFMSDDFSTPSSDLALVPHLFTWAQLRTLVESLLKTCHDMERHVDVRLAELPPGDRRTSTELSDELANVTQAMSPFLKQLQDLMTGVNDVSPSVPLVTDLATQFGQRPTDAGPVFVGPGTLMLWPVMDLGDALQLPSGAKFASDQAFHHLLADATIKFLKKHFDIDAFTRPGETGVWVHEPESNLSRRIAVVRPTIASNLITSFGVGLQLAAPPKHASTVNDMMTSLAACRKTQDAVDPPAALAVKWMAVFADLLADNVESAPIIPAPKLKVKQKALKRAEDSLVEYGPTWTVDHLEDSALGWRAYTSVDDRVMTAGMAQLEQDTDFDETSPDCPLHILGDLFDRTSSKTFEETPFKNFKRAQSGNGKLTEFIRTASAFAQGRPWLAFDKSMDTWHTRPINMMTISQLDLTTLDHRPVILGNEQRPSVQPIPDADKLITESHLAWPDLPDFASTDQDCKPQGGVNHSLHYEAKYKHYCAWVLRVLRESLFGRQLDSRLTDHSARYVAGEMLANPGVQISVIKGASASISAALHHGLNQIQCAAFSRRALMLGAGLAASRPDVFSRQEARLMLPRLRKLPRDRMPGRRVCFLGESYIGGLLPPRTYEEAVRRAKRRGPMGRISKNKMQHLESMYGKDVLRATGLKRAIASWRPEPDFLGRY